MNDTPPQSSPPLFAQFGLRLGLVSQQYSALMGELLEPHHLTWPQFGLLMHLARHGGPTRISELAQVLELTQPAITKMVQKFNALGLVEIARDTNDGRNRLISITPQGQLRLLAVQRSFGPVFADLTRDWTPQSLSGLMDQLQILSSRIDALRHTLKD